jgi:hypothetical protein
MHRRSLRRLLVLLAFAATPGVAACELAFDFDRTPLQPVYEGGAGSSNDAGAEASDAQGGRG